MKRNRKWGDEKQKTEINKHEKVLYRITPVKNRIETKKKKEERESKIINDRVEITTPSNYLLKIYTLNGAMFREKSLSEGNHSIKLPKGEYLINSKVISIR